MATEFEKGLLVGLLIGEGSFGGDGRQPQVTLRMHSRHAALFSFIDRTFPGGRVYGPYHHGGRNYQQWMARGSFLRDELLPLLEEHLTSGLDGYSRTRLDSMRERYGRRLGLVTDTTETGPAQPDPPQDVRLEDAIDALRPPDPGADAEG